MNSSIIWATSRHLLRRKFFTPGVLCLLALYLLSHGYVTWERWQSYQHQREMRLERQRADRESWESNPDKHPHRMAHFGAFAFRQPHPLSIFDSGLENYMGNVIFLEAHKQNTANFSEASLSTGLVRFGTLDAGMLLGLILPLFVFFIGYDVVSREREGRTLMLMHVQGASMRDILLGKSLGLWLGSALFFVPALGLMWLTLLLDEPTMGHETLLRLALLTGSYLAFFAVLALATVLVSAWSATSNHALLSLLGGWLILFVVLPRSAEAIGSSLSPSPSKLAFKEAIEAEVIQGGDPHNPNDPHFAAIRDSLLRAYQVDDVKELPFNYGGYLMGLGEERTSTIYAKHQAQLTDTYRAQSRLSYYLSTLSPYMALRQISSGLSGTDFETYNGFLLQSEDYRYTLAQYMNRLQMEHIASHALGSTEGRINVVSRDKFLAMPEFAFRYTTVGEILRSEALPLLALGGMLVGLMALLVSTYRRTPIL